MKKRPLSVKKDNFFSLVCDFVVPFWDLPVGKENKGRWLKQNLQDGNSKYSKKEIIENSDQFMWFNWFKDDWELK